MGYLGDPNILNAEPDYERFPVAVCNSNDPYLLTGNYLWGLKKVRAPEVWCVTTGATEFLVAVIDSGIALNHPDLQANIWTNPAECPGGTGTCVVNGIDEDQNGYTDDFYGWDFYDNDRNPDPNDSINPDYHGTHVAGTIGAVGNNGDGVVGMNWRVKLVALRVLPYAGGAATFASRVIAALNYCIQKNIKVSNNSYIGGGFSVNECAAIQSAGDQIGHIFVAAAGNSGIDLDVNPQYPASCGKYQPGCTVCPVTNIITVAATDQDDYRACLLWNWRNCPPECPHCDKWSNYGDHTVHLGAPGVSIYSTVYSGTLPDYGYQSGTSMAAPHVTGAVALVWAQYPTWTYQQVRDLILNSVHKGPLAGQTITGGRLDVAAAFLDCNNNGVADGIDVNTFTSLDCNDNNVPDECEALGACCRLPPHDCIACLTYGECKALDGGWAEGDSCGVCALLAPQPGP